MIVELEFKSRLLSVLSVQNECIVRVGWLVAGGGSIGCPDIVKFGRGGRKSRNREGSRDLFRTVQQVSIEHDKGEKRRRTYSRRYPCNGFGLVGKKGAAGEGRGAGMHSRRPQRSMEGGEEELGERREGKRRE